MVCFEDTELFACQKQHADFIKPFSGVSLGSQASRQPPAPCPAPSKPMVLGAQAPSGAAQPAAKRDGWAGRQAPTQTVPFCPVFGNVDVAFQRRTK